MFSAALAALSLTASAAPASATPASAKSVREGDSLAVESRKNAQDTVWLTYGAETVSTLKGFNERKSDPETDIYGGWMTDRQEATGFFRTQKIGDRWWLIDPDGYPYICKGVAVFSMGGSDRQKEALKEKFGTPEKWAEDQQEMLRSYGFNGLGAWSAVDFVKESEHPMPYTVIVSPMGMYKSQHIRKFGGKYHQCGWQGYRFDLAMVFDSGFDAIIDKAIAPIAKYKDDKYLVGYFTDNEIPWVNDALDRHLTLLAKDEEAYLTVRKWFEERKGKDAGVEDITDEDRRAFMAFYFDTYMSKVTAALRKYDPNHLYLGCRFAWRNPLVEKIASRYCDVISYNVYTDNITKFSSVKGCEDKPIIIGEFHFGNTDKGVYGGGLNSRCTVKERKQAFEETGIDPYFYTYRERSTDELLPWDFIDIGVSKEFMIREWERSKEAVVTPNCRQQCQGCGAGAFGGGVCYENKN